MEVVSSVPAAAPSRIRVLPPELADQIAAGEVVERPASVVKELVENAIDAGARRVDVEVEGGGRRLIRVVDDGCGMTPEEARLALRRHATSKLSCLEDLFAITTMGFRGEALPSIAAVSRLALVTCPAGRVAGFRLEVEGGAERDAREVGAPVGTQVEVRDLLWNVPARLKFLKADATEAAHITETVTRLGLAHPAVHLRLRHGGRVALDLPPHPSPLERVRAVLGRRLAARIIHAVSEENGVRVEVFLSPPDEAQATARGVWLLVGRRFVRDRGLLHAVVMGYGELIPRGRYPTAVVVVEPPPGTVDVNVHPQKVEVRFARPQEIFAAVRHGVASVLARAPWVLDRSGMAPAPVSMYAVASPAPPARPAMLSEVGRGFAERQERLLGLGARGWDDARPAGLPGTTVAEAEPPWGDATDSPPGSGRGGERDAGGRPEGQSGSACASAAAEPAMARFFGGLAYLGQLDRTYLVCEGDGELVLIDQHAAHERIAFQRLREAHAARGPRTQRLLFPRSIELDAAQAAAAQANRAALETIGFDLEPFGGRTWALKAAPVELKEDEIEATLGEMLSELAESDAARAVGDRMDALLATVACHSVVRAGDELAHDEARALLVALDGVDFRGHCPHGRPVLLRISVAEIARRFGRT